MREGPVELLMGVRTMQPDRHRRTNREWHEDRALYTSVGMFGRCFSRNALGCWAGRPYLLCLIPAAHVRRDRAAWCSAVERWTTRFLATTSSPTRRARPLRKY